ncbi:polysaccharide pyruvyl transferase family protein [Streptomyces spiramyceticus]|uniref:polysaccharide pyruvyl transferase family protein n=1 Tax=Streptomyces spiramyceticus TaxID=299717 RepID=UPI00237A11A8|nr:polysaccharide pyruvyl transferase family protein [Streptomyces spiramyceticus]
MKRILLRSGKSPFRAAESAEYLHQDLMATNSGNLLFSDSAHKLLSTPWSTITSNGIKTNPSAERAGQINDEYDVFVVPLANAFRPDFRASLDRLSRLIEQLTIPVVVLGVGAQVGADYDTDALLPMTDSVRRFATAVLEKSASIGVRGELTASYLNGLGFRDVDIIGCPSMFLYGDTFPELREPGMFGPDSRIALNLSPEAIPVGDVAGIATHAQQHFENLTYYAQNLVDAELLFWGDTSREAGHEDSFPLQLSHPLFREEKVTVPLDPRTWIDELADYDFAYGTRIHGNIAALLAGTPAVVLAHDSRTLELCRYFDLPHRMLRDLPACTGPEELYEQADFTSMLKRHRERFARIAAFLDKNDLENTYDHGDGGASFDARMAEQTLPPSLRLWDGYDDGNMRYRISRLREQHAAADRRIDRVIQNNDALNKRLVASEKKNAELGQYLGMLEKRLAKAESRLTAAEKKVTGIDRRLLVRIGPALRRRLRRSSKNVFSR